jgi:hypothetical protein
MPGQTIGTVNVQIGQSSNPRAVAISYGSRTLKSASDLSLAGAEDGDVISYIAESNSFAVKPVSALAIPKIDGGSY